MVRCVSLTTEQTLIIVSMPGVYHIFRFGGGTVGPMRLLGQYMMISATTFGCLCSGPKETTVANSKSFFMSIGSVIRTEGWGTPAEEAFYHARRRPVILDKIKYRAA